MVSAKPYFAKKQELRNLLIVNNKPETRLFYRKKLPHWEVYGRPIFDTLHVYGSLPVSVLKKLKEERNNKFLESKSKKQIKIIREEFIRVEKYFDNNPLISWLINREAAQFICNCFLEGARREQYILHAFVVMPNHIHWLFSPLGSENLKTIRTRFKKITSRKVNKIIGRNGKLWMNEGFDHWIRTPEKYESTGRYIENNPIKAGLAKKAEDWKWSSAST